MQWIFFPIVLQENFIEELVDLLPGSEFLNRSSPALLEILSSLADNFDILSDGRNMFNPGQFLRMLLENTGEAVVAALGRNETQQLCIQRVIEENINASAAFQMATYIDEIRAAYTTLQRIGNFIEQQGNFFSRAPILNICVDTFVELSFCSRCTRRMPPLCFNTCNNLLRACYSPYYTAFNRAFSRLWFVTRQVVQSANTSVQNFIAAEENLIDVQTFVSLKLHSFQIYAFVRIL